MSKNLGLWKNEYGVKQLRLFGSYRRKEQSESSDIDVLVEFNDKDLTFDNYMDLKIILEDPFQKPIDVVIIGDIKPSLRLGILKNAI